MIIWKDKAIVLSKINYSENSLILKAFTLNNGIKTGLVKGGKKLNKSNIFEAGNLVTLEWKGRNEDVLGIFNCDLLEANSAIYLNDSKKFMSIISMLNLIEFSFLENESESELFLSTYELIKLILNNEENWLEVYVKWELLLLKKIGFGLELSTCIVSNTQKNLVYVSPKSGCAVSKAAAKGYEKKLLPLPSFLVTEKKPSLKSIKEGLELLVDYSRNQKKHGSEKRIFKVMEMIKSYGTHSKSMISKLESVAVYFETEEENFPPHLSLRKASVIKETISEIKSLVDQPKLIHLNY